MSAASVSMVVGKQSWSEVEWSLNISFNTRNLNKSLNTSDPLSSLQKPSLDHLLCIAHLAPCFIIEGTGFGKVEWVAHPPASLLLHLQLLHSCSRSKEAPVAPQAPQPLFLRKIPTWLVSLLKPQAVPGDNLPRWEDQWVPQRQGLQLVNILGINKGWATSQHEVNAS